MSDIAFRRRPHRRTASTDRMVNSPTGHARFASSTPSRGELRSLAPRGQSWIEGLLQLSVAARMRTPAGGSNARHREHADVSWFTCSAPPWSRSRLLALSPQRHTSMCRHTRARRPRRKTLSRARRRTRSAGQRSGAVEHTGSWSAFRCRGSVRRLNDRRPPNRR